VLAALFNRCDDFSASGRTGSARRPSAESDNPKTVGDDLTSCLIKCSHGAQLRDIRRHFRTPCYTSAQHAPGRAAHAFWSPPLPLPANMAFPVGGIIGIIIAVIALIVFLVMWSLCYVVKQAEAIVIERFGRFHRVLKPGMNFIMPLADAPRTFTWRKVYIDAGKQMRDETITNYRIDLRESLFQFLRIEVYSKDTVLLDVSAVMFYRVVDVRRAIYDVQDLAQAVSDTAQSQLKRIFGGLTFAEAMQSQATINALMRTGVRDTYEKWGLQVERIELQDLRPKATSDTANAMKRQMIAERNRRSEFIHAEGNKAAMKLKSEGLKIVKANLVRRGQR